MKTLQQNIRRTGLVIVLLILTANLQAQSSIFDKFEDYDDVTTVVVTQKAFQMLKKISDDSQEGKEFNNLVSGLKDLKVFTTEKESIAQEMKSTFSNYIRKSKLSELMRVKDKDANVKIYVREGRDQDHVSEFVMLVDQFHTHASDKQMIIISLTGDIDLNNISKITDKMHIPGGEHMKDVERH